MSHIEISPLVLDSTWISGWTNTYAVGANGLRAVAAAAAASGPGVLANASAAALVGKAAAAALVAPTLRCIATPLSAAAVTTHANTRAHANYTRSPTLNTLSSAIEHRRIPGCLRETAAHLNSQRDEVRGSYSIRRYTWDWHLRTGSKLVECFNCIDAQSEEERRYMYIYVIIDRTCKRFLIVSENEHDSPTSSATLRVQQPLFDVTQREQEISLFLPKIDFKKLCSRSKYAREETLEKPKNHLFRFTSG